MSGGDQPDENSALVPVAEDDAWVDPWSERPSSPIELAASELLDAFSVGAALPEELEVLADFERELEAEATIERVDRRLKELSHAGYVRDALALAAESLARNPRVDLALRIATELLDALEPDLGLALARAVLAETTEIESRMEADLAIADELLTRGDVGTALRHFEAVLAVDIDHRRAARGWTACNAALDARGLDVEQRSRGLALLDGLEEVELAGGIGLDRYELGRPLGRGRHAVVYEAWDRRVGRHVAIKKLLGDGRRGPAARTISSRFFSEARTLARVRSPHVVALLDVRPRHNFIALELCRGGTLRLLLRRRGVGPDALPRIGDQLRRALRAVHAAGAVHRDVKPANILFRERSPKSPIALADFGLAVGRARGSATPTAGTLRYLAPEVRSGSPASPAADLFGAGVVLFELASSPRALPERFDRLEAAIDPEELVSTLPPTVDERWRATIARLLHPDPEARAW